MSSYDTYIGFRTYKYLSLLRLANASFGMEEIKLYCSSLKLNRKLISLSLVLLKGRALVLPNH